MYVCRHICIVYFLTSSISVNDENECDQFAYSDEDEDIKDDSMTEDHNKIGLPLSERWTSIDEEISKLQFHSGIREEAPSLSSQPAKIKMRRYVRQRKNLMV